MTNQAQNKMGVKPIPGLLWKMGLPMIVSMVLQSVYNIVDTAFVINMGEDGVNGNLALTYAFPIQILIIAVGVGTGIGINAILSKSLGEKNREKASLIAGNGIFLALCIYAVFLLFGLFGSRPFISMQALGNEQAVEMGKDYLTICCCFSFGSVGYAVYERFLQATGKTMFSALSQISGAAANIILDYIFIYPCGMGVAGAAWATVIGQILSLCVAMTLHYVTNREISSHIKYLKPSWQIIKAIYNVGISAAIMQALLSVMMLGMNLILGTASINAELLKGSFGIYYKIMQFALFAAFGISNTIITVLSFNYGMRNKQRIKDSIKYGIIISVIVTAVITVLFEILANPLARLFGLSAGESGGEIIDAVTTAVRIGAISYVFMGVSVGIQGVFQGFRYAVRPMIISFLRLALLVFPIAYLFTLSSDAINILWWTFPIVEFVTAAISSVMLLLVIRKVVNPMPDEAPVEHDTLVITISREHGSNGKYIGKIVAQKLGIPYFDKEILAETAKRTGLAKEFINDLSGAENFRADYLTTATSHEAIAKQAEVIRYIAEQGDCVIIGRGADYILKDFKGVIKVFVYANEEYKINTIKKLYGDDEEAARKNMIRSDNARRKYYEFISGARWGDRSHYDLCIDSSESPEKAAEAIVYFVRTRLGKDKNLSLSQNPEGSEVNCGAKKDGCAGL